MSRITRVKELPEKRRHSPQIVRKDRTDESHRTYDGKLTLCGLHVGEQWQTNVRVDQGWFNMHEGLGLLASCSKCREAQ